MAGTGQEPSPPSDANKEKGRKKTPKTRRYMKELPPEDYEMNTVSTVNPYIFVDEVEQEKRFLAYQERVKEAQERRRQRNKTIKKQERQFIQTVNERSSAPWFQDLSSRQMELTDELKNTLKSDVECKMSDLTQAYLRDLGVTPAVGAKTVRRAIKESSGDPVTFLIIVQKALAEREQREFTEDFERYKLALLPAWSFSVNERLLLSAAFHIHFPILTRKLIRILPPPPEPLKVKWAEKQKSEKPTYSSPYLEPLPINEMCWYEERAYQDLKAKVKRQIKKQKDREKYLKSLRPRKTQEQNQGQTEKDNETDDWERLLDQEDDDHRPAAKKKKVFKTPSPIEELKEIVKNEENFLAANPASDTNLLESYKCLVEDTNKEKIAPRLPAILQFYSGYKEDTVKAPIVSERGIIDDEDGISAPEGHISAIVRGKLVTKSSVASQTVYDPALGTLQDSFRSEHDMRTAVALSSLTFQDQEFTLMQDTLTYGYNDYRDDEPSETIVNLMNEIREDINLLKGVERYTVYKPKSVESLLTLPSDTSYLSVESYLYNDEYREGNSEEARKLKAKRKKKQMKKAVMSKKATSYNVECWDENCGLISSDEEIPMDEFKLAKTIIADLPADEALMYALKYLKDRGDPMAALPDVHKIPKLLAWYDKRLSVNKSSRVKAIEKRELLENSRHQWNSPYFKVSSMKVPALPIPRCVSWDWIDRVKNEAGLVRKKHFRHVKQQLVTNARNYFPSMATEYYGTKLMKDFRKTFYAYLPSKEIDCISYNTGKRDADEEEMLAQCYKGEIPRFQKPSDLSKLSKRSDASRTSDAGAVGEKKKSTRPGLSFVDIDNKFT